MYCSALIERIFQLLSFLLTSHIVQNILNNMEIAEQEQDQGGVAADELQFVEEVALGLERQGLFRMAGRVVGWLLICDPPEQTFNQLVEALQASKGSISTAMKVLVPGGLVERVSRPGERRDYYRVRPGVWPALARSRAVEQYGAFKNLTEQGLRMLAHTPPDRRRRLQEIHDFYDWLDREMPAFWARWERERQDRGAATDDAARDGQAEGDMRGHGWRQEHRG